MPPNTKPIEEMLKPEVEGALHALEKSIKWLEGKLNENPKPTGNILAIIEEDLKFHRELKTRYERQLGILANQ